VYAVSFSVDEPYPSEHTRGFIENLLETNGFQRLKHRPFRPFGPAPKPSRVPEYLDSETMDLVIPKDKQKGLRSFPWIQEYWLNKKNELVSVYLYYIADLETKKVDRDRLYANVTLFQRRSWMQPWILKYKELYPEELEDNSDPNESSD